MGLFPGYTSRHLIAAEGEGALAVETLLRGNGGLRGRKTLIYADTSPPRRQHAQRLAALPVAEFHVVPTVLKLLVALRTMDLDLQLPLHLYAAGSRSAVLLIAELAKVCGIAPDAVMVERCEPLPW